MNNHNGFLDAIEEINTLLKVGQTVQLDVLEEAANYFVEVLKPNIPITKRNKEHMRNRLKVVIKKDVVQVVFDGDAWYWHLVEHGHRKVNGGKVKGRHFVQNTWDKYGDKIADMMANKIIEKMGG
ncbi:HK97 gp10 family phage protein [Bacillus thermocopriae]|jgi:HK97 gp10 family phage protein|uniref:HK97 gp10 family phage protein n=1 Tax=Neobacillus thermocopriae TaxID=1215031 RepID=A0A6B3TKB9_9BACI|nr:HK97-gp10 family putative phage morphogenesis protein [Neobacillus thermocopriae]NEX77374.1 HK97 gp10 family phage protein [Neobacillus thermocopriae]